MLKTMCITVWAIISVAIIAIAVEYKIGNSEIYCAHVNGKMAIFFVGLMVAVMAVAMRVIYMIANSKQNRKRSVG